MGEANIKAEPQINNLLETINRDSNIRVAATQVRARFQSIMQRMTREVDMGSQKASFNPKDVDGLKKLDGNTLLQQLHKTLLQGGQPLEKQFIEPQHLSLFADLLTAAGFNSQNANHFVESLKARVGNRALSLATIFNELANFESQQSGEKPEILMELSALPYMETILQGLGLTPDQISDAFDGAVVQKSGIRLNRLIANLKQIDTQNANSTITAAQAVSSRKLSELLMRADLQVRSEDINSQSRPHAEVSRLMNPLLFPEETKGLSSHQDALTLPRLIAKLETMLVTQAPFGVSEETVAERISLFLEKITTSTPKVAQASQLTANLKNKILRLPFTGQDDAAHMRRPDKNLEQSDIIQTKRPLNSLKTNDGFNLQQLIAGASKDQSPFSPHIEAKHSEPLQDRLSLMVGQGDKKIIWEPLMATAGTKPGNAALPTYVLKQVGRQLIRSHLAGENEIRLQLKPPQLGRLQMYIERVEGVLKVEIASELQATKDLLLAHSQELKALLSDQGLRVDRIDVNINDQFEQAMAFNRQQSNQFKDRKNKTEVQKNMATTPAVNAEAQSTEILSEGTVHLVA